MYLRKKPFLAKVLSFLMPRLASAQYFRLRHIVPARANSPSILEGVAVGRGSNIGIIIPFLIILMLVILNNVFPQIRKHDVHILQHVKVCRVKHLQTETFQILVPLCVIISLPVV